MIEDLTGGTILIVEDERLIAEALKDILEDAGFRVDLAADADSAMAALASGRTPGVTGLVTDINLGGPQNGWHVASRAREMNAVLPVVYMSGDSAGDWAARGVPHSTMLQKPFAISQVVIALSVLMAQTDADRR